MRKQASSWWRDSPSDPLGGRAAARAEYRVRNLPEVESVTYYSKDAIEWEMDYYNGTEHVQVNGAARIP